MIDIHTHILPGMDDGARTIEDSIELLKAEIADGVDTVALTPHYRSNSPELDMFLFKRERAYESLCLAAEREGLKVRLNLSAEVAFAAELMDIDLEPLCYRGSRKILIELPVDYYPPPAYELLSNLQKRGYLPIIAHAERYLYFSRKPELLQRLVDDGMMVQVNAESLLGPNKIRKSILAMIRDGLVHAVATDTHGIDRRPPRLREALAYVKKKTGIDLTHGREYEQ